MKKLLAIALLSASLAVLTGCGPKWEQPVFTGGYSITASTQNPVTRGMLFDLENGATAVFAGLNTWRDLCTKGAISDRCYSDIGKVQEYTRKIPTPLKRLRKYVKENDQVNAIKVFNEIKNAIADAKNEAAVAGFPIGGK